MYKQMGEVLFSAIVIMNSLLTKKYTSFNILKEIFIL